MTEKVILPANIAAALKENEGDAILYDVEGMAISGFGSIEKLYRFYKENPRKYFEALVNGYQVEKSKEDHVRDYFNRIKELERTAHEQADHENESDFLSEQTGVIMVLNLLGIKIEGVNV